ncbi:MAG: hypothetical protein ACTHMY_12830 [Solirubrobacteraceae bacterium]
MSGTGRRPVRIASSLRTVGAATSLVIGATRPSQDDRRVGPADLINNEISGPRSPIELGHDQQRGDRDGAIIHPDVITRGARADGSLVEAASS